MNGNLALPTDLSMHKNELPCSFENDSEDKLEDVVGIFHSFTFCHRFNGPLFSRGHREPTDEPIFQSQDVKSTNLY